MSNETKGIALMLCAIFLFSCMDVMAKALSYRIDTVQAIWARYAGQTVIVIAIIFPRARHVLRAKYPKLQFLRSIFLLSATTCFFNALAHLGLTEATAIMNLNPVLITLGAGLILGEKLGPRRLLGIGVALIGALIIIRPGTDVFTPAALLPLGAALFYSAYALTTRFVGRDEDAWTSLFYTAIVGAIVLTAIVPWHWTAPDGPALAMMLAIGLVGGASQLLLIRALILAEASLIAPFAYSGLIFAALWGVFLFGERPDGATILGTVVIVGAGLYVWRRERQAKAILPPPMRDVLQNLAIRTLLGAALAVPYRFRIPMMGWIVARIVAPLAGWDKRVRANLAHVLPDLPQAEVKRLMRAVPNNAGRSLIEAYSGTEFKDRVKDTPLTGPGLAALQKARAENRPTIMVTGHFGNYDAPRAALAHQGFPLAGLYREMKNRRFNEHYVRALSNIAPPVFPATRKGLAGFIGHLKQGNSIGILIDVYAGDGAKVQFFGKTAPTATSAAEWAIKYQAEVIPIYGVRQADGLSFEIFVDEPIPMSDAKTITQALNDSLERMVRQHMEQWFWIHRRWKPADQARRAAKR